MGENLDLKAWKVRDCIFNVSKTQSKVTVLSNFAYRMENIQICVKKDNMQGRQTDS